MLDPAPVVTVEFPVVAVVAVSVGEERLLMRPLCVMVVLVLVVVVLTYRKCGAGRVLQ